MADQRSQNPPPSFPSVGSRGPALPSPNIVDGWTQLQQYLSQTRASVMNRVASDPTPVTVAGLNSLLPLVYGRARLGAKVFAWGIDASGALVLGCAWCIGPNDAIEEIRLDDGTVLDATGTSSGGIVTASYLGAASQSADPTLVALYAAQGKVYADTLPYVCYSVIVVPPGVTSGMPRPVARIRGMKVALTDGGTPTWTDTPAYCLADFITSTRYGAGSAVDWGDVATLAAANEALVGGEKTRLLSLALDTAQPCDTWIDALRDYAGCFVVPEAGVYRLIPDAASSVVATFTAANIVKDSLRVAKRGALDQPTVVQVTYTDTSNPVWRDNVYTEYRPGVLAGTVPRRLSQVPVPGITRYSQAVRYARERLNDATTSDVTIQFRAFDEGIQLRVGDLIAVNHTIGFGPVSGYATGKPFRVIKADPDEAGRWAISATEFDPAKYSTDVVAGPTLADTVVPTPDQPPAATGVTLAEDVYQVQTGRYGSRIKVAWDDATWPFVAGYVVTVTQNGDVVDGPTLVTTGTEYLTKQLTESLLYVVTVAVRSTTGQIGTAASASIVTDGKLAKPSDVPSITGFEVGGEVRLAWEPATDLDLTAHEIRYGTTGGTWESATLLDRVATPAVRYVTRTVPAGTWRFWVKGLDSVRTDTYPWGQESVNAAYVDIDVTSDAAAFVAGTYDFTTATLGNMSGGPPWVTDFGDTWASLFPSTMSTYTQPLASYHTAGTSGIATEIADMGASITGDWYVGMTYTNIDGTAKPFIELSAGPESARTITGATNATPIVLTITAHGYNTGDEVQISGVLGNTAANGQRLVTVVDANHVSLQDIFGADVAGSGTYTSGGSAARWTWSKFQAATVKSTARYVRARLTTDGTMSVDSLGSARCNVVARSEGGTVATLASGPAIVVFANRYNKAVSAVATGQGAGTPLYAVYDNIEVDGARGVGVGQALLFDGSSDYVDVSDATQLRLTTALTVEAWVKFLAITGATQGIVRKDTESGTRYMWGMQLHANGRLQCLYYNGTVSAVLSLQPPPTDRWMHVAMTISGTTLTAYVDGIAQGTTTIAGTQSAPTGRMSIGANPPYSGGTPGAHLEYFGGRIDEVRVWNVARSQAQIQAAMGSPAVGNESGLVALYHFDALTGTQATDSTSNLNHGTVSGAKWRPLNGMDLYTFNAAGAQQAGTAAWHFSGV